MVRDDTWTAPIRYSVGGVRTVTRGRHGFFNAEFQYSMKNKQRILGLCWMLVLGLVIPFTARGQAFTAPQGSIYGGVLNTPFQPASTATSPYAWQLEIFGINGSLSSHGFLFTHNDPRFPQDSSGYGFHAVSGDIKRWAQLQSDVSLLHAQFQVHHGLSLGLGLSAHAMLSTSHSSIVYTNTMKQPSDFFVANSDERVLSAEIGSAQWMDVYVNLAKVLKNDDDKSLSVGGTLALNKGLAAEWVNIRKIIVQQTNTGSASPIPQFLGTFDATYAYSSSLDKNANAPNQSFWQHAMQGSSWTPSLSLGMQFVHRKGSTIAGMHDTDPADYLWKFEASVTDFGALRFNSSPNSTHVLGTMDDNALQRFMNLIDTVNDVSTLTDSLRQQVATSAFSGPLKMSLPTALRLNFDKKFAHGIAVNVGAVLDASILVPGVTYHLHTLNYAVVTPRWENKHFGAYLPLYVNQYGKGMIGAAVRVGPLLVGLHDVAYPFQHEFSQGGAYMALVISHFKRKPSECPKP